MQSLARAALHSHRTNSVVRNRGSMSTAMKAKVPLLEQHYGALVMGGHIASDECQKRLVRRLSRLQVVLQGYVPPPPPPPAPRPQDYDVVLSARQSMEEGSEDYASYEGDLADEEALDRHLAARAKARAERREAFEQAVRDHEGQVREVLRRVPRGVYVYGEVGTGKSMVLDLFFETTELRQKRRVHFHQFMLEVHRRIHAKKQAHIKEHGRPAVGEILGRRQRRGATTVRQATERPSERDALREVAADIADEAHLLCFDEFQVTDVADALIMVQLFRELWRCGTVVVATSNRPPDDLYKGGLNREYFLPFLRALDGRCATHSMHAQNDGSNEVTDSSPHSAVVDYRRLNAERHRVARSYVCPELPSTEEAFEDLLYYLQGKEESATSKKQTASSFIPVMMGRSFEVRRGGHGVALFNFDELCATDVGAADFKALCDHFHTLLLVGVPKLTLSDHNEARRFVTLIDELYEHGIRLLVAAAAPPDELFSEIMVDDNGLSRESTTSARKLGLGTDRPQGPGTFDSEQSAAFREGEQVVKHVVNSPELSRRPIPGTGRSVGGFGGGRGAAQAQIPVKAAAARPSTSENVGSAGQDGGDGEASAVDAAQETLVLEGELASIQELGFAFRRAASRLVEMGGGGYHNAHASAFPHARPLPE